MPMRRKTATRRRSTRKRVKFATRKRSTRRKRFTRNTSRSVSIRSSQLPFPKKYSCKLHSTIEGYIAAGTSYPIKYTVFANGLPNPFLTAESFPNALPAVATLNPIGLSQLLTENYNNGQNAVGAYNNYKVNAFSSALTITPIVAGGTGANINDVFDITTMPYKLIGGNPDGMGDTTVAPATGPSQMYNNCYSKSRQINGYNTRNNTIKNYYNIRKVYGYSKLQWQAADITVGLGQQSGTPKPYGSFIGGKNFDPTNQCMAVFGVKSNGGATSTSSIIAYKLRCTWYVTFINPVLANFQTV